MIQHAIVTKVFGPSDKDKSGSPYKTKGGKPYSKIAIKTDKTGEDWYSTLVFKPDAPEAMLKEGDEKQFVFEQANGFKNFRLASKTDVLEARVTSLEQDMKRVVAKLQEGTTSTGEKVPDFTEVNDINPDDIPY